MSDPGHTENDRPTFGQVREKWMRIRRRRNEEWSRALTKMARTRDKLIAERRWQTGPSDLLGVIGRERDELIHTRMLAWLLDPTGRHGLGDRFLRSLLEHARTDDGPAPEATLRSGGSSDSTSSDATTAAPCGAGSVAVKGSVETSGSAGPRSAGPPTTRGASVKVSYWKGGREADVVAMGNAFTLVIEIKVDADEQPRQIEDLYRNFQDERSPCFLFLTPDGRRPTSACTAEADQAFRSVSWPQIRKMVQQVHDDRPDVGPPACPSAAPGRHTVANYLMTLKEQFG